MPAPLHRDWCGQRRTESAHCPALIWSPIGSLAHWGTMMGRTVCPVCPCPSPTPLRPPLTSLPSGDPPSVCGSPDQQPRQYAFHHSGPQCLFHKLSQALGLKGGIGAGFGLCKHTNSRGWKQSAPAPPACRWQLCIHWLPVAAERLKIKSSPEQRERQRRHHTILTSFATTIGAWKRLGGDALVQPPFHRSRTQIHHQDASSLLHFYRHAMI